MLSIIIPNFKAFEAQETAYISRRCFPDSQIIIANDFDGKGKGWAVREGLKKASGDFIAILDADMDIHPKMINRLFPFLEDYDIAVGTKGIEKGLLSRRILTHLSRFYIRLMFGLKVDTQTGIKLYKRDAVQDWVTNGFAFDIENLVKAKRKGFTMVEVPIDATITKRMSSKAVWKTFVESLKIRFKI